MDNIDIYSIQSTLNLFSENKIIKKHFRTGIKTIDDITDGGLCPGLTILSGMPSLGKSTFALQMANNTAEIGNTALFFSIEMAKEDCLAKIISRKSYHLSNHKDIAFSSSKIMNEKWLKNMTEDERALKEKAINATASIAKNFYIFDVRDLEMSLNNIFTVVSSYIEKTGIKPIVFIDYLHLISAPNSMSFGSEKQVLDYYLKQLNAFAKKNEIPIVLISTLNRGGYKDAKADMDAFCGTNLIEYGCDFALILDYTGKVNKETNFDIDEARNASIRRVTVRVVKNRFGSSGANINYLFTPIFNDFKEIESSIKPIVDIDEIPFSKYTQTELNFA